MSVLEGVLCMYYTQDDNAGVMGHLSVCPSGDDLALVRTVAHCTEHGIGKDDLAPYKPPVKRDEQLVIVGGTPPGWTQLTSGPR